MISPSSKNARAINLATIQVAPRVSFNRRSRNVSGKGTWPESGEPPPVEAFVPRAQEVEDRVVSYLGSTALFAARFRENAARALLLPRRSPNKRTPLWLQRRKSADLLAVASKFREFPILLETYRECLRDVFDLRGLASILQDIERRAILVRQVETRSPSPFASTLMFTPLTSTSFPRTATLVKLSIPYAQSRSRSIPPSMGFLSNTFQRS